MALLLEICVDSVSSALIAANAGADRLELCQELSVGGLTPSLGLIRVVRELVSIPLHVLIRPRAGNFHYSAEEVRQMEMDIKVAKAFGINGIVFGALDREFNVDKEVCQHLIAQCSDFPVTFHRAFDLTKHPNEALEEIIELGFSRVLTSGLQKSAYLGMQTLKKLIEQAGSRITIMPGCGISPENLTEIIHNTKAKEFHASARKAIPQDPQHDMVVVGATEHSEVSEEKVQELKKIIREEAISG